MGPRAKLEEKIRKKQEEIEDRNVLNHEAAIYIQAWQECLKLLPPDDPEGDVDVELRAGSQTARARDFIQEQGGPMHITKILRGIGQENNKANRASLAGSLGNYARKNQIFRNFGSNYFGLIGMAAPDINETMHEEREQAEEETPCKF